MFFFESDYIAGAHPQIMKRLAETNLECLSGYGTDKYCESAREKIRACLLYTSRAAGVFPGETLRRAAGAFPSHPERRIKVV